MKTDFVLRRHFCPELDPDGACRLYALLVLLFNGPANIPPHLRPAYPPRPLSPEEAKAA